MKPRPFPSAAALATLAVVYIVAGKLGLTLAFQNASATPVWPATGIALAALVILGYRAWPAILIGAFFVNLTTTGDVVSSVGIALGNMLEALAGAYLVTRFAGGRHAFDRARDVFKFTLFAALGSTLISPTIGVGSLLLSGLARPIDFGSVWLTWWFGDAAGDLLVAPVLLLWSTKPRIAWKSARTLEAGLLAVSLVLVSGFVFGGLIPSETKNYPLEFLCLPLLVWAAFRFGQREAATVSLVLSAIAIWGTLSGLGPFTRPARNESLLLLQAFMGVVAVTTTSLAAVIAERRGVQESLFLLESAVDNAVEGLFILTPDRGRSAPRITFVNEAFRRITGLERAHVLGETLTALLALVEKDPGSMAELRRALFTGQRFHGEALRARRRDGTDCVLELQLTPVGEGGPSPTHWVGILRDVTERMAHLEVLEHHALYDFLTGLPNRVLLRDRLDQAIRSVGREDASLALLVMDLDRFKDINDTFGHQFGDLLLKEFGLRLRGVLRTVDTVARLGGDEFAVLLPSAGSAADAALMAEKILVSLQKPFLIEGQSLDVSASIGIALCPRDGDDWSTLLRCGDVAMYAAKQSSEGYVVYSAAEDTYGESGFTLMKELRSGVEGDQLHLHYQPQIHMRSGRTAAVEALLRWQHPRRGLLLPGQFVPAAERTGVIKPVCEWALETALGHCRGWHEAGRPVRVAVNVSGRNLRDPLLFERLSRLLGSSRLDPGFLKLEIAADSVFADPHGATAALTRIKASGVRLSIDDFGSSESSLSSLRRLPVDEIKIAGAFVREMSRDPKDAAIVRCAIELGHSLGQQVVAQDVEDAASWEMLEAFGCDFAQGRYVSPALPRRELTRWLEGSVTPG
ncbi:MAG TPA: EAL domain-containing protein [Thermoanaerobaculia bacterium]|nr:EAL domain-containing protein [Thermoanaerobaculia bacterium]